ncbi:MAG: prepilin-type N-terminal cleavage/methylation domain-containing protein [Clostridiales bacterium]|nr:prepilin-type N-terminal cleavage/methylation domain-containing protein [Clostridiales bacterium]
MREFLKNNKAFSLLEVTIAMGILVIGILGVFSLVIQNVQVQTINKQYLIASMLAQEGIEIVRNKRDNNWLDDDHPVWYKGIADGDNNFIVDYLDPDSDSYTFDFMPGNITDNATQLYLNANHFYTHVSTGNTATPYHRLIEIYDFVLGTQEDYFRVVSRVQWTGQGRTHEYIAETLLYNWRGL